jgi:ribA/ribD-fused uncharacterized protein
MESTQKEVIDRFAGDYRFLSNFYPAEVLLDGIIYRTVEHAYQAAKTEDEGERRKIRKAQRAAEAKSLGGQVKMRPGFENAKIQVMYNLLEQKFSKGELRQKLLDTGNAKLVEGNDWNDKFWGSVDGVGKNWLGRLLMEIRSNLQSKGAT